MLFMINTCSDIFFVLLVRDTSNLHFDVRLPFPSFQRKVKHSLAQWREREQPHAGVRRPEAESKGFIKLCRSV